MATDVTPSAGALHFVSLNLSQEPTILFIHGGFSSHAAWYPVLRHLSQFHILLVDLPGHGSHASGDIRPITLPHAASLVAAVIREHAHNSKAHIVGFSFGAYTAFQVAADYPAMVGRVYTTGTGRDWNYGEPAFLGITAFLWFGDNAPKWVMNWFETSNHITTPPELKEDSQKWKSRRTWAFYKEVLGALRGFLQSGVLERVKAPVLLIAGTAHDPVDGTKMYRDLLKQGGCEEVRAVKLEGYTHAWEMRDPELYARSVTAWVDSKELPKELEEM